MSSTPALPIRTLTERHFLPGRGSEPACAVLSLLGCGGLAPEIVRPIRIGGRLEIGRGALALTAQLWQLPDETISRRQAVISEGRLGWTIADLGSHNGTTLGRTLLKGASAPLPSGSLIVLGGHVAVFRLLSEEQLATVEADTRAPLGPVPTIAPAVAAMNARLRTLGATDRPILLSGETGTGKEVYARATHGLSGRPGPFLAVNCASLPHELLESELFGYKRGSHSQAVEDHPGVIRSAEGGTLFLDEIGEMAPALQAKLLRFLQDKSYLGLGALRARQADVRVIAATHDPERSLRPDVLARFGAEPFRVPPLRERREDIGALGRHFLAATPQAHGGAVQGFDKAAFVALFYYDWPRNVRELEAAVSEAALLAAARGAAWVGVPDLPARLQLALGTDAAEAPPLCSGGAPASTAAVEAPPERRRLGLRPPPARVEIVRLLRDCQGDVPAVARALDRRREQVWRWCRLLGLDPRDFRAGRTG
jgi:transcriptional regulator with PAS, ATPase and Fis domain